MTKFLATVAFLAVVPPGYGQQSTGTGNDATLREFAELVGNAAIKFGHEALRHLFVLIPATPERTESDQ